MHQALQPQPLLRPKPTTIIFPVKLIAYACRRVTVFKICGSKHDVPNREQNGKINAACPALMPNTNAVMDTMKPWAHQQIFTNTPERKLQIRMGQALDHTGGNHDSNKLHRRYTNQ